MKHWYAAHEHGLLWCYGDGHPRPMSGAAMRRDAAPAWSAWTVNDGYQSGFATLADAASWVVESVSAAA